MEQFFSKKPRRVTIKYWNKTWKLVSENWPRILCKLKMNNFHKKRQKPNTFCIVTLRIILVFDKHCVKSVRIRSYSGPYSPTFGLSESKNIHFYWTSIHRLFSLYVIVCKRLRNGAIFKHFRPMFYVIAIQQLENCIGVLQNIRNKKRKIGLEFATLNLSSVIS